MPNPKALRKLLSANNPNWEVEEGISPEGKIANKYYFKGERARRVRLISRLAQQAAGYTLIEKDLRNIDWSILHILSLLEKIAPGVPKSGRPQITPGNQTQSNLMKMLLVGAVTLYGKLFVSAKGRRAQLDRSHVAERLRTDHDFIMELRHNFAAHSGEIKHEEATIVLLLEPNEAAHGEFFLSTELKQPTALTTETLDSFLGIVKHLQKEVMKRREALFDKIVLEQIKPVGHAHWYSISE